MTNTAIILNYMQLNNLDPNQIVLHPYATWKNNYGMHLIEI